MIIQPAEVTPEVLSQLHILVIDDHPDLARTIRTILERDGHRVVVALGGQDGLDAFRLAQQQGEPFAAVITDFSLPDLDGLMVAAAVKQMSAATPVIMLTGYVGPSAQSALPLNVDSIFGKPPRIHELRSALRRSVTVP
jgi:CheY-like chemotaxis protein